MIWKKWRQKKIEFEIFWSLKSMSTLCLPSELKMGSNFSCWKRDFSQPLPIRPRKISPEAEVVAPVCWTKWWIPTASSNTQYFIWLPNITKNSKNSSNYLWDFRWNGKFLIHRSQFWPHFALELLDCLKTLFNFGTGKEDSKNFNVFD